MLTGRRTADHPLWREMVHVTNAVTRVLRHLPAGDGAARILGDLVQAQRRLMAAIEGERLPWVLLDLRRARAELCRLGAAFAMAEMLGAIQVGESVRVRTVIRHLVDLVDLESYSVAKSILGRDRRAEGAA